MENEFRMMAVVLLFESKLNPRRHFDKEKLAELAASVKSQGVLEPLLVRAAEQGGVPGYEIIAGARRFRAAKEAGLEEVPVRVVQLDDLQALEVMVVENGQREDVHPLEEAQGFHLLHTRGKFDVARIAEKIGRTPQYVYDRLKLLNLTKEAQKLFLADRFTAGHAVILARLSPEDQARAIDGADGSDDDEPWDKRPGGLWQEERRLFHPEDEDENDREHLKAVTVRELQAWIDQHTKLEADQVDQMVLPDTAAVLQSAAEEDAKVVRITHDVMTPEEAKDGPRVILGRSWQRADGQRGSKQCERSVIGMVVIGPGRGEAFPVCIDKKRCEVHWGDLIKAAKKREKEVTKTSGATGEDREALRRKKQQEEEAKQKAEGARWEKAKPAILAALETAIRKGSTGVAGAVGKYVLYTFEGSVLYRDGKQHRVPAGKTGDDLLRHMAYRLVVDQTAALDVKWKREELVESAKAFGIDLTKVVDQAAPLEKPAAAKASAKKATTKAKGKGPLARKKKAA